MKANSPVEMNNVLYIDAVKQYEKGLAKPLRDAPDGNRFDFFLQAYAHITERPLSKEEHVVDFGCGSGAATKWLNERGYRADGVDILEYWGKDRDLLGEVGPALAEEVHSKLHVVDATTNRLPFPDSSVGFLFSDQTLEHVFDYRPVFAEQARVLKRGGIAIHRFPHGLTMIEPHTKVPIRPLTQSTAYLAIWAMLGRRNERQVGFGWRETLHSNRKVLATTNYVSRRAMLRAANGLGLEAWFEDFLRISKGRAGRFYRGAASVGAGALVKSMLSHAQDNRLLVFRKLGTL